MPEVQPQPVGSHRGYLFESPPGTGKANLDVTALHVELGRAIEERTMFRPWLDTFATVAELADDIIELPADETRPGPLVERWLVPDVLGRQVHWLAPNGSVDGTVVDTAVFEPPAQFASFSVAIPGVQLDGAPLLALDEAVNVAAAQLDEGFRRRMSVLRAFGTVQVGLWTSLKSKLWQGDVGWHMNGRYLVAAVAIA